MTPIKGLYTTTNRKPGKPARHYVYAWRGGPLIMTKVGGAKPVMGLAEVELYHKAIAAKKAVRPETFASLIADYRQSVEWKKLADSTRRNWTIIIDRIEAKWGKASIAVWNDPLMITKVMKWRNESADQPRKADNQITVLRHMLNWARLNGKVLINVAVGIPQLYDGGNRAEIVWTTDEIEALAEKVDAKGEKTALQIMDGIRLATLTGMRLADLAALKWENVGPRSIVFVAEKKSKRKRRTVTVPLIRDLKTLLAELRTRERRDGVDTVLVNSFGRPWTSGGLGNSVTRTVKGVLHSDGRQKHLHDMRGTYATRLILAGLTDREAADVLGWSPERVGNIRKVYVDQHRVIVAIADRIDAMDCQPTVNQRGGKNDK